jgi:hypothetical protein
VHENFIDAARDYGRQLLRFSWASITSENMPQKRIPCRRAQHAKEDNVLQTTTAPIVWLLEADKLIANWSTSNIHPLHIHPHPGSTYP